MDGDHPGRLRRSERSVFVIAAVIPGIEMVDVRADGLQSDEIESINNDPPPPSLARSLCDEMAATARRGRRIRAVEKSVQASGHCFVASGCCGVGVLLLHGPLPIPSAHFLRRWRDRVTRASQSSRS